MKLIRPNILFLSLLFSNFVFGQNKNYISLHLKNESFQKGRLVTLESDYFFDIEKGELIIHGPTPRNHIKISNRLGEVKIYFPDENKVTLKQDQFFSSENELIYYFLSNNYYDLGLSEEGFSVTDTKMDGKYQIITWTSPAGLKQVAKAELVFENDQPVYAAYFNLKGNIIRKIYYYNYTIFESFILPTKVTQITYLSENDSIIQRNSWTDVKVTSNITSPFFNYKIPENAKISQ
jgi:hypothetical protein